MKKALALSVVLFASFGARAALAQSAPTGFFEKTRVYRYYFYESQEECDKHQDPEFHVNCFQSLSLEPNGTATLMLSDIMNLATYHIEGSTLFVETQGMGNPSPTLKYEMSFNGRQLVPEGAPLAIWELVGACQQ